MYRTGRRVWHDVRNRTSPVCSDNTTCCPTEHDLNHVVFVPEHSDDLTNPKKHKETYIKYKNVELMLGQHILFLPSSYVPGETFGSTQSTRRCWNLWQRTGNQWMFLQILKKMGTNIQYLEFLLNRVNFKTNRTFESCVVTEKWHKTAIKTRFKEFIQHLFHASLTVTLRTLCLTPPSARPRCGNVRLFFITI